MDFKREEGIYLTQNLMTVLKRLDNFQEVASRAVKTIEHLINLMEKMSPIERAAWAVAEADRYIDNTPTVQNTVCKRGCAYCCHQFVAATKTETALIADYITKKNIPVSTKRIRWQAKFKDPGLYWKSYGKRTRCIFLDQKNDCMIYPVRPMGCRSYFSAEADPKLCAPDNNGDARTIAVRTVPEVEFLITAMANLESWGSFYAGKPTIPALAANLLELKEKRQI